MERGLYFLNRFARDNWFKLFLLALVVYVFFQKDLSFQIQFRSPTHPGGEDPPAQVKEPGKREKMTHKSDPGKIPSGDGKRELFDLAPTLYGGKGTPHRDMLKAVSEESKLAYLKRFARVAVAEQKKFGMPASIILANALLYSAAGQAEWATKGNNQFALACTANWSGPSASYDGKCCRHYESAWESFRDNSLYLSRDLRESLPFGQEAGYKLWAKAIAKTSNSREDDLAATLTELIETYRLFELDGELP